MKENKKKCKPSPETISSASTLIFHIFPSIPHYRDYWNQLQQVKLDRNTFKNIVSQYHGYSDLAGHFAFLGLK